VATIHYTANKANPRRLQYGKIVLLTNDQEKQRIAIPYQATVLRGYVMTEILFQVNCIKEMHLSIHWFTVFEACISQYSEVLCLIGICLSKWLFMNLLQSFICNIAEYSFSSWATTI
jgi:hypothetical protein